MARTGKIARLPPLIFEEFNERLLTNPPVSELLEWVNGLPEVQERLEKLFDGKPITDANVSIWRAAGGGFEEWKRTNEKVALIENIVATTTKLGVAAGGRFARLTLPAYAGKLWQALEKGQSIAFDEKGKPFVTGLGSDKLAKAIASLAKVEQDEDKIGLAREQLEHDRERLALDVKRFQRQTAELFIEYVANEEAKRIALGSDSKENKITELVQMWFGKMPDNIGPPSLRKGAAS